MANLRLATYVELATYGASGTSRQNIASAALLWDPSGET
jgi:hypothetical protein